MSETRRYLAGAAVLALVALAGCTGYWAPGGAAPWCRTKAGRYDCRAARLERDSVRADSLTADTTGA
jgi:hypothetical protein